AGGEKGEKIKVTLLVVLAKEDGASIDPRLQQLADEIQKRNPQLKSFRVQSMTSRDLRENQKSVFEMVDKKTAEIVVKQAVDDGNRVDIGVTPPDQGEIVYRATCGKFVPIVTRYKTKASERLILALRVEPCLKN